MHREVVLGGKKEHRSYKLYCGFTKEITSKKVRTQGQKEKICGFIIHAAYLQLWQFFHRALHPNNRWNGL